MQPMAGTLVDKKSDASKASLPGKLHLTQPDDLYPGTDQQASSEEKIYVMKM